MSVAAFEFLYTEHLHLRGIVAPDPRHRPGRRGPRARRRHHHAACRAVPQRAHLRLQEPLPLDHPDVQYRSAHADPPGSGNVGAGAAAHRRAQWRAVSSGSTGILPGILDRFFESREAARRRGDQRAVYAYKIVMNSFYGVLGTPGCRFAASALAGAITTLGQHILYWARDRVTAAGYEVIYGDTDSLFVLPGDRADATAAVLASTGAGDRREDQRGPAEYVLVHVRRRIPHGAGVRGHLSPVLPPADADGRRRF